MALEHTEQSLAPTNSNTNDHNWNGAASADAYAPRQALNGPREKNEHLTRQEKEAADQLKGLMLDVRNVHRAEDLAPNIDLSDELNQAEGKARQIVLGLNSEQLHHVATKLDNDSALRKLGFRAAINPKDNHLWIGTRGADSTYSTSWSPYTTDK